MAANRPIRVTLLLLLAAWAVAGGVAAARRDPRELPVYVTGAARLRAGEPLLREGDRKPFTYPPAFALPMLPFVDLPRKPQAVAWYLASLLALAASALLVDRRIRPEVGSSRTWILWCGVALLAGRHVLAVLENEAHDYLVLLPVAAAASDLSRGRWVRAGALAGLAGALKATPLLFLLLFVARRRWGAAAAMLLVAAALTLLPDLLFPQRDGRNRVLVWAEGYLSGVRPGEAAPAIGAGLRDTPLNQSLAGTLHRLLPLEGGAKRAAILLAQLLVTAFLALLVREREGEEPLDRFGCASAIACGMVLLSPMSSKTHFCVLLLPIAFGLARAMRFRGAWGARVPLLLLLLLGPLTAKGLLGKSLGDAALERGSVTGCALAALLLAAWGIRRGGNGKGRGETPAPPGFVSGPASRSRPA